jgi:hypothetical protein
MKLKVIQRAVSFVSSDNSLRIRRDDARFLCSAGFLGPGRFEFTQTDIYKYSKYTQGTLSEILYVICTLMGHRSSVIAD